MVQLSNAKSEDWAEMARMYKKLTVETSVRPIQELLTRTNALLPFSETTGIHDNGCGPGPVLARLLGEYGAALPADAPITCSDFSPAMIEQVNVTKAAEVGKDPGSVWARVDASVQDAMDLRAIGDGSRSHVTAGWVYFMTPDPAKCLGESLRVLRRGGVLGCSSWEDSDWLAMTRLAGEVRSDVQLPSIPEGWRTAPALRDELAGAGFRDVEAVEVPVKLSFDSYDTLVELLTEKLPHMIHVLKPFTDEERATLKARIREMAEQKAPTKPYSLSGTALVAVGRK